MDVVLGILRDIWTTVFGLPDSTMEIIFGAFGSIIDWFTAFGASLGMLMEFFELMA